MPTAAARTLVVRSRKAWRAWLARHHDSVAEVWLVFHKQHAGGPAVAYEDAVEEALCFGWIDSLVKRLDDDRYARKFTPRKAGSVWSASNRRRYASLEARGLLAPPGRARAPTGRTAAPPVRRALDAVPRYIQQALDAEPKARAHFERLAPSYRRAYIGWIDTAKREATKLRRLREAVGLLAAGRKLGLK
jgi:uncharacterized protein YdeI (YjbR/CyaY-like superfamily)